MFTSGNRCGKSIRTASSRFRGAAAGREGDLRGCLLVVMSRFCLALRVFRKNIGLDQKSDHILPNTCHAELCGRTRCGRFACREDTIKAGPFLRPMRIAWWWENKTISFFGLNCWVNPSFWLFARKTEYARPTRRFSAGTRLLFTNQE